MDGDASRGSSSSRVRHNPRVDCTWKWVRRRRPHHCRPGNQGHHSRAGSPHRTPRFRDWAAEETDHPREVIEPALAHDVRNPVDAAYARSDLFERRRRPSYTLYSQRTSLHSGSSAREGPVGDDEDLVALHGLGVAIGRPMPIIRLLAPAADYSSSNRRSAPAGHRKGPGSRRATGS